MRVFRITYVLFSNKKRKNSCTERFPSELYVSPYILAVKGYSI